MIVIKNLSALMALSAILLFPFPGYSAERGVIYFGDDYDYVFVNNARKCRQRCESEKQCVAWTFIRGRGQCRLKSFIYRKIANNCCVSGTVDRSKKATTGSIRVTTCKYTFRKHRSGWREHFWRRRDCTNGLPPLHAQSIGQASNGNGTGGQVECTPQIGRHYNNPDFHGNTSGTVKCLYISH